MKKITKLLIVLFMALFTMPIYAEISVMLVDLGGAGNNKNEYVAGTGYNVTITVTSNENENFYIWCSLVNVNNTSESVWIKEPTPVYIGTGLPQTFTTKVTPPAGATAGDWALKVQVFSDQNPSAWSWDNPKIYDQDHPVIMKAAQEIYLVNSYTSPKMTVEQGESLNLNLNYTASKAVDLICEIQSTSDWKSTAIGKISSLSSGILKDKSVPVTIPQDLPIGNYRLNMYMMVEGTEGWSADKMLTGNKFVEGILVTPCLDCEESSLNKVIDDKNIHIEPNPICDNMQVKFEIDTPQLIKINILDISGRIIKVLFDGKLDAASHSLNFIPNLSSGIYFVQVVGNNTIGLKQIQIN